MNKKEWKLQHAANRRMYHGLFAPMGDGEISSTDSENFSIASSMVWEVIYQQHPSFTYALQRNRTMIYPLAENRWAAKSNSTAFYGVRVNNEFEKLQRKWEK